MYNGPTSNSDTSLQALQNWQIIANTLNISSEAIERFNEHFLPPDAFEAFQKDSPSAAAALIKLEAVNVSLRFIEELQGDEQRWFTAKIEEKLQTARAIGSILNQVNAIIDFATHFDPQLEICRAALDTRMRSRLAIERASQLILKLVSEILNDEERFQEAEEFINGHLLSIVDDEAKLAWLAEKTDMLCQEENPYRILQTLGLTLNQAELQAAENDNIDANVEEAKRRSVRNALDTERRIATILRYDYKLQPEENVAFRKAIQEAAPNDVEKQQTLFTRYEESTPKEEFSLAGFKRYVNSKNEAEKPATSSSTVNTSSVLKKRERVLSLVDSDDDKPISRLQDENIKEKSNPKKKLRR